MQRERHQMEDQQAALVALKADNTALKARLERLERTSSKGANGR